MMTKAEDLQEEVVKLISFHSGPKTANLYRDFFDKEDAGTLINSTSHILTELLGEKKASEEIKKLSKKLNKPSQVKS